MPGTQLQTAAQADNRCQQHAVCHRHAQRLILCAACKVNGGHILRPRARHIRMLHQLLRRPPLTQRRPGLQFPGTLLAQLLIQVDKVAGAGPGELALHVGKAGIGDEAGEAGRLHHVVKLLRRGGIIDINRSHPRQKAGQVGNHPQLTGRQNDTYALGSRVALDDAGRHHGSRKQVPIRELRIIHTIQQASLRVAQNGLHQHLRQTGMLQHGMPLQLRHLGAHPGSLHAGAQLVPGAHGRTKGNMQAIIRLARGDGSVEIVVIHAHIHRHGMQRGAVKQGKQIPRYICQAGRRLQGAPGQQHHMAAGLQILAHLGKHVITPLLVNGAGKPRGLGLLYVAHDSLTRRNGNLHHPGHAVPAAKRLLQLQHGGQIHTIRHHQHGLCRHVIYSFYTNFTHNAAGCPASLPQCPPLCQRKILHYVKIPCPGMTRGRGFAEKSRFRFT